MTEINDNKYKVKRMYKTISQKKSVTVNGETKEVTENRKVIIPNQLRIDVPGCDKVVEF